MVDVRPLVEGVNMTGRERRSFRLQDLAAQGSDAACTARPPLPHPNASTVRSHLYLKL